VLVMSPTDDPEWPQTEHADSLPPVTEIVDLSVTDDESFALLRSRRFASVEIRYPSDVTVHRGTLRWLSQHLSGRNPMASVDGARLVVRFSLGEREPDAHQMVELFARSVAAGVCGNADAIADARVLTFDTTDIDDLLLPEHRPEEA
jgi:hypothetical protein